MSGTAPAASPSAASSNEASAQDASAHEAVAQEALAATAADQLAESNDVPPVPDDVRNLFKATFGFGGVVLKSARRPAFSWPTPAAPAAACGTGFAVTISAPLIWSGVQSGCRAINCAATPDTTGA